MSEDKSNYQVSQTRPSALSVMAGRYNVEPAKLLSTLKETVFKGASDSELLALVVVANEYNLNPLTRQIYAFPSKGGGITPIVSVDGWMRVINENPHMDGVGFEFQHGETGELIACECTIWRNDRNRPVRVTEYLAECRRNTDPWKMEHRMLRHKALIQCARVAFGLAGIYDEDEAARIQAVETSVKSEPVKPSFKALPDPEKKPARKAKAKPEPEPEQNEEDPGQSESEQSAGGGLFDGDSPQVFLLEQLTGSGVTEKAVMEVIGRYTDIGDSTGIANLPDEAAQWANDNIEDLKAEAAQVKGAK